MQRKFNRYRVVVRFTVRVRREGGSLSLTIPRHIVRHLGLESGDELIARMTEDGIVLRPQYFRPWSGDREARGSPSRPER
jgi:antitoxin component of MazEF toxin-antitoxin module